MTALAAGAPGFYTRTGKRLLDLGLCLALLPVALPLVLCLAGLLALGGARPFFVQTRLGRGGRRFAMLKLRTMTRDADARLARLMAEDPAIRAEWQRNQKLRRDPRVTPLGRLLRKTSLDEVPQLWNVLCGDMSLVGPRPMMPEQAALYPGRHYFDLRPGLTGPWQVSDRHEAAFAVRAAHDDAYARQLSLGTDLALLGRTLVAVLRGTGA